MLNSSNTRPELAERPCTTAILPVGALEQHGSHLPIGTDNMLAEAISARLGERLDAYVLPPLTISSSIEHRKAKGTVYLRADTLALVVRDIAESIKDSGFTRLIVANFHGGNWIIKPTIRQFNRDWPGFRVILLNPEPPPALMAEICEHPNGDIHAGEFETSLMLHLFPKEVRSLPAGNGDTFPRQAFLDYFDITDLTRAGHWGWPGAATEDKGRRALALMLDGYVSYIEEVEATAKNIGDVSQR